MLLQVDFFLREFDIVVHGLGRAKIWNLRNLKKSFGSITTGLCGLEQVIPSVSVLADH